MKVWGRADACPKADFPPVDSQWARAFIGCSGAKIEKQYSPESHLEIGHWWSDLHHLDCFKYS